MLPIFEAAANNDGETIRKLLESQPDLTEAREDSNWTPLHRACCSSCLEAATALLENGADVNAQGNARETPLHLADNIAMVRLLLLYGADPRKADRNGMTPLHFAEAERNHPLVELLHKIIDELEHRETTAMTVSPN